MLTPSSPTRNWISQSFFTQLIPSVFSYGSILLKNLSTLAFVKGDVNKTSIICKKLLHATFILSLLNTFA